MIQLAIRPHDSILNDVWLFHRTTVAAWARAGGREEKWLEQAAWPAELERAALGTRTLPERRQWRTGKEERAVTAGFCIHNTHTHANPHVYIRAIAHTHIYQK